MGPTKKNLIILHVSVEGKQISNFIIINGPFQTKHRKALNVDSNFKIQKNIVWFPLSQYFIVVSVKPCNSILTHFPHTICWFLHPSEGQVLELR